MTVPGNALWHRIPADILPAVLRTALGIVWIAGGFKLAFHADPAALAASYTNPGTGWISPFFVQVITEGIGLEVSLFLVVQGWAEMILGLLLIAGAGTPVVPVLAALAFWSFAVANPVAGEIRLSRDIALAGLCLALAAAGPGRWSVDAALRGLAPLLPPRRDALLLILRLSLAYTLLASALFSGGPMSNHLNLTLPLWLVFALGLLLAAGIYPRWAMLAVALWMIGLLGMNLADNGFYLGLDSVKRELGFLAGATVYFVFAMKSGSDRWAIWPRPGRQLSSG